MLAPVGVAERSAAAGLGQAGPRGQRTDCVCGGDTNTPRPVPGRGSAAARRHRAGVRPRGREQGPRCPDCRSSGRPSTVTPGAGLEASGPSRNHRVVPRASARPEHKERGGDPPAPRRRAPPRRTHRRGNPGRRAHAARWLRDDERADAPTAATTPAAARSPPEPPPSPPGKASPHCAAAAQVSVPSRVLHRRLTPPRVSALLR